MNRTKIERNLRNYDGTPMHDVFLIEDESGARYEYKLEGLATTYHDSVAGFEHLLSKQEMIERSVLNKANAINEATQKKLVEDKKEREIKEFYEAAMGSVLLAGKVRKSLDRQFLVGDKFYSGLDHLTNVANAFLAAGYTYEDIYLEIDVSKPYARAKGYDILHNTLNKSGFKIIQYIMKKSID